MYQSKLISHIKEFSRVELTQLKDFVHSPYFNKHPQVTALMDYLYDLPGEWPPAKLKKETVFKRLFPEKKYDYARLAHVMNYLQKLMDEFVAIRALQEDPFLKQYMVLQHVKKNVSGKLYEQKLKRLERTLDHDTAQEVQLFYYRNLAENELDLFYLNRKKKANTNHLQRKSDNLDIYYIANKLEYWCDMFNRSNVLNMEYEYTLIDELMSLIKRHKEKYLNIPLIHVYYHILKTLQLPEEEANYYRLKEYLLQHSDSFKTAQAKSLYDYAQNYCIKKINRGNSKYVAELLSLYRLMLDKELIYEHGYFPPSDFKNIVTIACRLKEFEWTEEFINKYKDTLAEPLREHVFKYNLASLYYERGDKEQALSLLHSVEFTDVYFALGARSMLMKIYYELGETDPLFSHFQAFKTYLRRNKLVSKYQSKVHSNFIKFTKSIYQLKLKADWERVKTLRKSADELLKKISEEKEVTNKEWLLKQVGLLQKSKALA